MISLTKCFSKRAVRYLLLVFDVEFIIWRLIGMKVGSTALQSDWCIAGLSTDLLVFAYSVSKSGWRCYVTLTETSGQGDLQTVDIPQKF